ncbi:unnamed protein product [Fraxinus pennsylvanica]|uniref:NIF system FeS cluster assembly NifU C-terminal domain-containing protein n=1 Tax=Fraxinus pennsylvanica TaxID=56036 RepID=A0AAD2DVV5_9LAMI|nr:unnamed protein product [Fraxinus pennsylvanica]
MALLRNGIWETKIISYNYHPLDKQLWRPLQQQLDGFPRSSNIPNKKFQKPLSVSIRRLNLRNKNQPNNRELNVSVKASVGASGPPSATAGLYSSGQFELNIENVGKVLDNVRPYLIADGGNVDVVSLESGVVSLKLQDEGENLVIIWTEA